jgi:hypothetical protein
MRLAELDRRLSRLERALHDGTDHAPSYTSPQAVHLQEGVSRLQEPYGTRRNDRGG